MKKIKFRAWDEEISKMYSGNNAIITFSGVSEEVYVRRNDMIDELIDYKLMESTGLTDIKVDEIYGGDIVRCNENDEDLHEVRFGKFPLRDFDTNEIIDFVTGWFLLILENDKLSKVAPFCYPVALNDYWIKKLKIKIVGNIYENKELLD